MHWTSDCYWLAGPMTCDYFLGEVKELLIEVKRWDRAGMRDELGDVVYCGALLVNRWTGLNMPIPFAGKSIKKFVDRFEVWEEIFAEAGLEMKYHYFIGGNNWRKPEKVEAALALAREEQRRG